MGSLRTKLTLGFLAVSGLAIAAAVAFAGISASGAFRNFVFATNREGFVARLAAYYVEHNGWEGVASALEPGGPPPGFPGELRAPVRFTLVDKDGRVVLAGPGYHPGQVLSAEERSSFVAVAVKGTTVGWLQTPVDTFSESRREAAFLERVNGILLVAAVGAAVLALIAGAVLARSLTRPLRDLTDATQAIAAGDFNRRVAVRSRDELGTLAESFNRMSAALAEAQRVRRQMTADIAHELRTPLAIILGHLDAVGDGVLADSSQAMIVIREETERLARLVEDLRTLTRADSGELRLEPRPSDLGALLRQAATARRPASRAKRITLQVEAPEAMAPVVLDPDRIAQVIGNLLTNALFHTPDGGRIEVGCLEQGRSVRVWVRDSGPGIESDELPRVFDRFYRTDKSRRREDGGSGLGLAIARSIVEAHAGRIWAESLAGFGASILFELPRVPASDA